MKTGMDSNKEKSDRREEKPSEQRKERGKKQSFLQIVFLLLLCSVPLLIVTGCGPGDVVRCSAMGDDDTRLFVYASGTDRNGISYDSCVGPAGLLGFGLDTYFWPTECVRVKQSKDQVRLSGCVAYYNETGCIDETKVKSRGVYSQTINCLNCQCFGAKYVENTAETTQAFSQTKCFGCGCGGKEPMQNNHYNEKMPRQFPKGCWSLNNS